jgi:hypothetical protein
VSPRPVENLEGAHCRLAALILLGALSSCDAPQPAAPPAPPKIEEKPVVAPLTKQQSYERSAQCGKLSHEQFRRAWSGGPVATEDGPMAAEFTSHYNERLNTCFYLLTLTSANTLKKMLYDVNGGELYGEYHGPVVQDSPSARRPKICRVESFYCASWREWEVLVDPYMED